MEEQCSFFIDMEEKTGLFNFEAGRNKPVLVFLKM
jgi:hypothetical protein